MLKRTRIINLLYWSLVSGFVICLNFSERIGFVLLSLMVPVAFFAGYYSAIGKPVRLKDIKNGDYFVTFESAEKVVSIKKARSSHSDKSLLVSGLPSGFVRVIDEKAANGVCGLHVSLTKKKNLKDRRDRHCSINIRRRLCCRIAINCKTRRWNFLLFFLSSAFFGRKESRKKETVRTQFT